MPRYWSPFTEYVPVAERRARAQHAAKKLAAKGRAMHPVVIEGRTIARSFWGKAWCDNVENYRDFAYRLERGRSYVRSGAVIDLVIEPGAVKALVQGSMRRPYEATIRIDPLPPARWEAIKKKALGKVSSLLDLAAGRVPEELLRAFCDPRDGLFPARGEISFSCSCPDSARLCKHLAAVFYGIGARLDEDPALFFTLRGIDPGELLSATGAVDALTAAAGDAPEIDASALGDVFGVDFDDPAAAAPPPPEVASPKSKVKSRKSQVAKESPPPGGGWREAPGGERDAPRPLDRRAPPRPSPLPRPDAEGLRRTPRPLQRRRLLSGNRPQAHPRRPRPGSRSILEMKKKPRSRSRAPVDRDDLSFSMDSLPPDIRDFIDNAVEHVPKESPAIERQCGRKVDFLIDFDRL